MGCKDECSNCGGSTGASVYRVKAYIEYEIEADNEEQAINRLGECIFSDLDDGSSILDIAEVNAEKIKSTGFNG
jgi:hypothetical protein